MARKGGRGCGGRGALRRGLTLIEILIALIIMVLGICGILALFPPALDSGKKAMEETQAAITGQSVANALAAAVRLASYDPATETWMATLVHDLDNAGASIQYTFALPRISEGVRHHPGNGVPATSIGPDGMPHPDPEVDTEFRLCGDPWIVYSVDHVHGVSDPSDPLNQFAFSFDVHKVNSLGHLLGQMKPFGDGDSYSEREIDNLTRLYEFNIHVFRVFERQQEDSGDGFSTRVERKAEPGNRTPKRLIATVATRAATK